MNFEEEWAKMLNGEIYDAVHPEFIRRLENTRQLIWEFNNLNPSKTAELNTLFHNIVADCGDKISVNQPFRCDYGCNIHIGNNFFANFNLTILDEAPVRIGNNVFVGPNVSIFTACHPINPIERNTGIQWAEAVTIGNNVWIGGNTIILPGVTVGDNCVVGAGSVVTKNVPSNTVIGGNPARFIKAVTNNKDNTDSENLGQLGLDSCGD